MTIKPTVKPRIAAEITTMKASYMKMRWPSVLRRPIERRTPYSQTASLMFWVMLIMSKKKAMMRAMAAMIATKT